MVSYIISDAANNLDTCTFSITVRDVEAPEARCQSTNVFINPSGQEIETITAQEIDFGSTDNCGIDSMFVTPSSFNCLEIGTVQTVELHVFDEAGNESVCETIVGVVAEAPQPTASSGLCGGDTLFLFANPPTASGANPFTFRWYFDDQLISIEENVVLPDVDATDEGPYTVEVRGVTGCVAEGVVFVSIEDLPLTPSVLTKPVICTTEDIELSSDIFPIGEDVLFSWYRGEPNNEVLLGTSDEPSFTIPGPHAVGEQSFFVTV